MKEITFVDTTLRDAHQSLWNGRMTTAMMVSAAEAIDAVGFEASDFMALISMDWCVRHLKENPWDRIRLMAAKMPHTSLITGGVLRNFGNIPDAVTELLVKKIAEAGAKRIRINEPCHDIHQIEKGIKWSRAAGLMTMAALIYSYSPVHTDAYYAQKALDIAKAGADRIFIKDVGGLLTPERTRTLVTAVKKKIDGIPLEIHAHCTTGLAPLCYLEAIRHGAETVHTAVAPLANGPSQPSAENILKNAKRLGFSIHLDEKALKVMSDHFRYVARRERYPIGEPVEYDVFQYEHQIPGGMMANYKAELAARGIAHRLDECLEEITRIRKELGYPIMVTPLSQYIGAQAVLNLSTGRRYQVVTDEIIKYALGHYGELIAPIDGDVMERIKKIPRTKELLNWQPPQVTIEDLRKEFNGESDEAFLLRVLGSSRKAVDEVLTAGSRNASYPRGDNPVLSLIREAAANCDASYIHIGKGSFSLTLS